MGMNVVKTILKRLLKFIYIAALKFEFIKKCILLFKPIMPQTYQRLVNAAKFEYARTRHQLQYSLNPGMQKLLSTLDQSRIYLYVDHTCTFAHNTGIQQLVRNVLLSFLMSGCDVIPVKWNQDASHFQTLSTEECRILLLFIDDLDDFYRTHLFSIATDTTIEAIPASAFTHVLFVPEVTHINSTKTKTKTNITAKVIQEGKRLSLKTIFVFYDATPIQRPELQYMRKRHTSYMREIMEADFIFSISDFSKEDLYRFLQDQKVEIQNPPVVETVHLACGYAKNLSSTSKRSKNNNILGIDDPFILCVGSMTKHKNQLTLIKSFQSFKTKYPQSEFKLVLIGNIMPDIAKPIHSAANTSKDIIVIENAPNETVIAAYQKCSFTVFPSLLEGFGLPIIESLAFNKPCITACFGAMAEIGTEAGCVLVDTRSENALSNAIARLATNDRYLAQKTAEATAREIDSWLDYVENIVQVLQKNDSSIYLPLRKKTKKRIFWLGIDKVLIKTELPRLRDLGFEVFNPPYLTNIKDQSTQYDWDSRQETSLPPHVFDTLSKTNFFNIDNLSDGIAAILNEYFDCVIVTISPNWLAPILRQYRGKIIYRTYGQAHLMTDEFVRLGLKAHVCRNSNFHFVPHALEAVEQEADWVRTNETEIHYCLPDDVFGYLNSWVGPLAQNGEIALSCPNISNPFYAEHYKLLKQHFKDPFYKMYGVQLTEIDDPAVVGTLPRFRLLDAFRNSACYIYTYSDPWICYLPPIEAIIIGMPVLFPRGCLLHKYFKGIETPALYDDFEHCQTLVREIRTGNLELINEIVAKQQNIMRRYKPSEVWPIFDNFFLQFGAEL